VFFSITFGQLSPILSKIGYETEEKLLGSINSRIQEKFEWLSGYSGFLIDFSKLLFFPIDEHVLDVEVGSLARNSKRLNLKVAKMLVSGWENIPVRYGV